MPKRKRTLPPEENPTRYTQERLFWGIDDETVDELKALWKEGDQLATEAIPEEAICCVILLAAYVRRMEIALVDDYPALLQRARTALDAGTLHHPDLFFVSCTWHLYQRGAEPTIGGFTQIGIPELYEALIGGGE